MPPKTLADWLQWQESLNPAEIDLTLDRIRVLVGRLNIRPPAGRVFTVAGTNGKGSTSAVLAGVLQQSGYRVGVYSSPHLVRYNERIVIDGKAASDAELVTAFERIAEVRDDIPLTYFEYGTLAAWLIFVARDCDAWVLEVGLGGRLDAVNAVDPDFAVITTIGLDHQAWLGDSIEAIAAEKAGIMRADTPAFFGDSPVPESVRNHADKIGTRLQCLDTGFGFTRQNNRWSWRGSQIALTDLALPSPGTQAQLRNISVALAALETFDVELLRDAAMARQIPALVQLPGRFQQHRDQHEWVLDVAHNPQAAAALREGLDQLSPQPMTIVLGMMADKDAAMFVAQLADIAERWVVCTLDSGRAMPGHELAELIKTQRTGPITVATDPAHALATARQQTPAGERILVCGSFLLVGPAIDWLGLY